MYDLPPVAYCVTMSVVFCPPLQIVGRNAPMVWPWDGGTPLLSSARIRLAGMIIVGRGGVILFVCVCVDCLGVPPLEVASISLRCTDVVVSDRARPLSDEGHKSSALCLVGWPHSWHWWEVEALSAILVL